jgi:hypothetical protein
MAKHWEGKGLSRDFWSCGRILMQTGISWAASRLIDEATRTSQNNDEMNHWLLFM